MKVVHVHVKLEVPDEATGVAEMIAAVLKWALPQVRKGWHVKETH